MQQTISRLLQQSLPRRQRPLPSRSLGCSCPLSCRSRQMALSKRRLGWALWLDLHAPSQPGCHPTASRAVVWGALDTLQPAMCHHGLLGMSERSAVPAGVCTLGHYVCACLCECLSLYERVSRPNDGGTSGPDTLSRLVGLRALLHMPSHSAASCGNDLSHGSSNDGWHPQDDQATHGL